MHNCRRGIVVVKNSFCVWQITEQLEETLRQYDPKALGAIGRYN